MNRLKTLERQLIGQKLETFEDWRAQSTIDKDEMREIFYGPNHGERTRFMSYVKQHPDKYKHYHLLESSREEMRKSSAQLLFFNKGKQEHHDFKLFSNNPNVYTLSQNGLATYDTGFSIKYGVHMFLYTKTIYNLGTQKHQKFVQAACDFRDIGCFGLTELLHGSNVRGILTEAHYDHTNKEFILNSPTKEAMKFWIGAASNVANMSVIWAQLYIDGKCYGVHPYIAPIRDRRTHKLIPGVLIGDCGPKNGHNEIDNGFILLDNYRIPKDNQLDRISGVDQNGKFRSVVDNEDKRFGIQLGALSGGRFMIAMNAGINALSALTIAIRYVCVRRQFANKLGERQNLLIEYPLTKRRMMPLLAQCFIYQMGNMQIICQWDANAKNILDPKNRVIQQLHAISSVTKPKSGWFATQCIKQCRQMLGGHGFSAFSKLGSLYSDNDINNTWEGDNTVLIQQTAKYALDQANKLIRGKPIESLLLSFLPNAPSEGDIEITEKFVQSPECAEKFLQFKIKAKLQETGMKLMQLKAQKVSTFDAWNKVQPFLAKSLALTIGDLFYLKSTLKSMKLFKSENNKRVVNDILILWMLKMFREDEFVDQKHHGMIEDIMVEYCEKISKESLGILESISACDQVIGSPFADPEGRGFDKYVEFIMNSRGVMKKPHWWKIIANRGEE